MSGEEEQAKPEKNSLELIEGGGRRADLKQEAEQAIFRAILSDDRGDSESEWDRVMEIDEELAQHGDPELRPVK
jgi:hypothetical protein